MLVWLLPWVGSSLLFCLALARAAARRQPELGEAPDATEAASSVNVQAGEDPQVELPHAAAF